MSRPSERDAEGQSLLDTMRDWYHVPALLLAMVAMFAVRMQGYSRFVRDGEVFFSGNDAWYHLREVTYTVKHFPFTMPFDPWTNYPYGTHVGQFGTLYDQIIAFAALVIGLGSPSEMLVAKTLLVAPAMFGALAVIPTYLIGKRLGGRLGGLFGVLILALLPGTFLQRTLVGAADHNAAEPFFMGLAVFGLITAFAVAERSMPVWEVVHEELVETRDVDSLREPLVWSLVAGLLIGIFLWVWPPAIFMVGIVGLFVLLKMSNDVVHGHTPEPVAFVTAVSMGVVALMSLLTFDSFGFSTTMFSLLHPLAALGVAGAAIGLSWLARYWERENIQPTLYPAAILGIVLVGVAFLAVAVPSAYGTITSNLLRIVGFSAGAATRTIGEAQPFLSPGTLNRIGVTATGRIMLEYGLAFFSALVAVSWLVIRPLIREGEQREIGYLVGSLLVIGLVFAAPGLLTWLGGIVGVNGQLVGLVVVAGLIAGATLLAEYTAVELFVIVWAAFITSMAFTQVRFNYYLAIVVAVLNAFLFAQIIGSSLLSLSNIERYDDVEFYQAATVVAVVLLILAPVLAVPIGVGAPGQSVNTSTAVGTANGSAQPGSVLAWEGSMDWMQNNTPKEGNLGGAGNAEKLDYYGKYQRTEDYQYPNGAYGVMSWWDYGHWITVQAKRIPDANPFQEGATRAANFLLAPNETRATQILDEAGDENEQTRYVVVDWQMASTQSKYGAPIVFYDDSKVSHGDFYQTVGVQQNNGWFPYAHIYKQRYYNSTMTRLYRYHGSAQDPAPIVTDWEMGTYRTASGETVRRPIRPTDNTSMIKTFDNMSAARAYVANDSTSRVGGVGKYPSERVPAMEHYRLVKMSERQTNQFFINEFRQAQLSGNQLFQFFLTQQGTTPGWVKTFEKVPGATVKGSGAPPNTEVTASVQMTVPSTNSTFVYTQHATSDENGNFELVLPYSTTGYQKFGPKNGYTNVSVRANTSYTVTAPATTAGNGTTSQYGAKFDVSEAKVLGVDESAKQVTMTEKSVQPPGAGQNESVPNGNDSAGNGTETNGTDANGTDSNGTDANGTDSSGTDGNTTDGSTPTSTPAGTSTPGEAGTATGKNATTETAGAMAAPSGSATTGPVVSVLG